MRRQQKNPLLDVAKGYGYGIVDMAQPLLLEGQCRHATGWFSDFRARSAVTVAALCRTRTGLLPATTGRLQDENNRKCLLVVWKMEG